MTFDFDSSTRRALGHELMDFINEYFSSLPERPVQLPAELRKFESPRGQMPEEGEDAVQVLEEVCRDLSERGFHVPAAHYLGLMNPTPTYMAVLAEALVAALNPQLATIARSHLASKIEDETVHWIGDRVGWDCPFQGTFTTGGNEANFSALAIALTAHFPGIVENGVASIGAQPVFYASAESHHSLDKSAGLLGLGRKALRRIAVTESVRMDTAILESTIESDRAEGRVPFCVVATAGTTSSGAIDDMAAIGDICKRQGLWMHVDGAYGAALLFSNQHRALLRGIEHAQSLTLDPHKWLAMPFSAGVLLTTRPELLRKTFEVVTPYMPRVTNASLVDNFKVSAQWSRRMNSLKLWLTLRVHGRQAYEEMFERQFRLARSFTEWIEASEHFELAAPQVLPIVNFRVRVGAGVDVEATNRALVAAVTRDGKRWISTTHVKGESVVRMGVISYLSNEEHVQGLQDALTAGAAEIRKPIGATAK